MRIAFIGKGGAGKSTIVGTFARLLARAGGDDEPVLVLDSDVMPGLAHALGIEATDAPIPDEAVADVTDRRDGDPPYRLRDGLDAAGAVDSYAHHCPDGVRLLQLGKLRGSASAISRSHHAYHQVMRELPADAYHLVGDLPGGTRQPFYGWGNFADTLLVVTEPTAKSFLTARRMLRLADLPSQPRLVAVANKVEHASDGERVAEATGLEVVGEIPWDPAVGTADRAGRALLDIAPDGPAVAAVGSLVERMRNGSTT